MDIEITDSALNQMIFAPFAMFMASGYEERSDDGYKQAGTIAGSPGFESWEKDANRGEVTVIVANRFVVQVTGRRVSGIDQSKGGRDHRPRETGDACRATFGTAENRSGGSAAGGTPEPPIS